MSVENHLAKGCWTWGWGRRERRQVCLPGGVASVCRSIAFRLVVAGRLVCWSCRRILAFAVVCAWSLVMLTITALTNAEYVISSVALSIDEYYSGVGESPGVWAGKWAPALGLSGMVEADQLRALVEGRHPTTGLDLVAGHHRARSVRA